MDEKRSPMLAGVGGAALAAALVAMGGHSGAPTSPANTKADAIVQQAGEHPDITSNQEGPWYAFCQEYATTEFDHGEDPSEVRGITGHQVPEGADAGTAEITRDVRDKKGHHITEKFNVRKHTVGALSTCVPPKQTLRVAIAMVPDPDATQMRLDFDRDIVAIQRAAAAQHYAYTRYWFPWRGKDWIPEKNDDPESETRRRQEPGILCFRKQTDDGVKDRLFILLVGETPTSGANRIQLAHALYYGEELTGRPLEGSQSSQARLSESDQIDIAGPHFSASFKAIRDVLTRVKEEHLVTEHQNPASPTKRLQMVNLVSPDASGDSFINEFQKFCADARDLCSLRTLSPPSSVVRDETLKLLNQLGYESKSVAQWSEDESAFGIGLADQTPGDYALKLSFPRDLSSVRSLSDEQSTKVAEAGSKYFSLPGGSLPTQLSAREPIDRDSPAAFGAEQEEAEVARSLAGSVEEMRLHHIRAVVISASNPLDRIYLLEYLHNQLPDVRAVTTEADTLELDRPHFVDLTGTIAVTPLAPLRGMSYSQDKARELLPVSFASSRQEGEFLAVETLLKGDLTLNGVTNKSDCLHLWVVGGSGFRPMTIGSVAEGKLKFPCQVQQSSATNDRTETGVPATYLTLRDHSIAPRGFLTFTGLVLILNLIHGWGLFASRKNIEGMLSYTGKMPDRLEPRRLYLLFAVNNQLLILDILVSRLGIAYNNSVHRPNLNPLLEILFFTIAAAALAAAVISVQLVLSLLRHPGGMETNPARPREMKMQIITAGTYLIWSIGMVCDLQITGVDRGIFLERITHLGDGLSPVVPITAILFGYFFWGWIQLRRLEWSASRKAHLEFDQNQGKLLRSAIDSLQEKLDDLSPTEPRAVRTCAAVAIVTGIILWQSLNGLEGKFFSCWFGIWGVIMLLLTVALSCVHAWSIWRKIRDLLTQLGGTSMSTTFKNLADRGTLQVKVWDLAKTGKNFKVLQNTVESIERLYGAQSLEGLNARSQLNLLLTEDALHRQLRAGQIDDFSKTLNIAMTPAVESLYSQSVSSSLRDDELQTYFALRLVALIRYGMLHIGTLVSFVAYGFVLAVLSIMLYPFEGRKTIGELLMLAFLGLLIWVGVMMVQFQRNEMLSHLDGSKPGEANYWQVVLHLLAVGGVPLIAVLTSQFPGIANFAYSFFRPLLGVLH